VNIMSTQPRIPSRPAQREPRGPVTFGAAFRAAMSEVERLYKGTNAYNRKRADLLRRYMAAAPDARETVAWEYVAMRQREVRR
jgi:hypothetical protein